MGKLDQEKIAKILGSEYGSTTGTIKDVLVNVVEERRGIKIDKYELVPTLFKHLKDQAKCVKWNSCEKTLRIEMQETNVMDVYNWILHLRDKETQIQKSPFVNLEAHDLSLVLYDDDDSKASEIRFKNLSVVNHKTTVHKSNYGSAVKMCHTVILNYQYEDVIVFKAKSDASDQEWNAKITNGQSE